jgi:hypothetical protein
VIVAMLIVVVLWWLAAESWSAAAGQFEPVRPVAYTHCRIDKSLDRCLIHDDWLLYKLIVDLDPDLDLLVWQAWLADQYVVLVVWQARLAGGIVVGLFLQLRVALFFDELVQLFRRMVLMDRLDR